MPPGNVKNHRVRAYPGADVCVGRVIWAPAKSLWFTAMTIAGAVGGTLYFSWSAFALFLVTSGFVLLTGHSVGMHRRLIHGSFQCAKWLDYLLVYFGTLVGLAGPLGLLRTHDMRDFAQRLPRCHDYFAHRRSFFVDAYWQLHCDLVLANPPTFLIEPQIERDPVYRFLERTWMLQQLPWAILLFWVGGWGYVYWGVCARVSVCVFGHWLVGYFAHGIDPAKYTIRGAAVQGLNVRFASLLTMGESWHNNHHAFPGSAKLGVSTGEWDPGWWFLKALEYFGLAWKLKTPSDLPHRSELLYTLPHYSEAYVRYTPRKAIPHEIKFHAIGGAVGLRRSSVD